MQEVHFHMSISPIILKIHILVILQYPFTASVIHHPYISQLNIFCTHPSIYHNQVLQKPLLYQHILLSL